MKLSEVAVDKNTLPTQYEIQIVKSIFDGNEKIKATSSSGGKSTLLTTVVVGIIITFLLVFQPSLNNFFSTKVNSNSSNRFLPIFIQVAFSMFMFYLITHMLIRK